MRLTGIGVSPGSASGRALLLTRRALDVRFRVAEDAVDRELQRLQQARQTSRRQLTEIKAHIANLVGPQHAYLFDAQLLMLDDPMLVDRAANLIASERLNAEWALRRASEELETLIEGADDPYLRERRGDLADVVGRVGMNLRVASGRQTRGAEILDLLEDAPGPLIIVADELPASVAAQIDWTRVNGFITDAGSWTYHTAILARSLAIPGVAGLEEAAARIAPGATIVLDGTTGEVIVDPEPAEIAAAEQRRARRAREAEAYRAYRHLPAVTADGIRIVLEANVERPEDVEAAREYGAEGIGLYRSEFLLAGTTPDEDTQYEVYRLMLDAMGDARVTIRTFDASEEQLHEVPHEHARERSTLRGVALTLAVPELFRVQLRALLRAARRTDGQPSTLRIMFPFVTGVEELRQAIAEIDRASAELRLRGDEPPHVPVGAMVEVPSAALTADLLSRECDFLSIGTNDLIQFCLAADRTSNRGRLYEPVHPAVLRMLRFAVRVARRRRRPVSLCGEMAADAKLLPLLVGLGLREFSMTPGAIPHAKQVIRSLHVAEARTLALRAMNSATSREIDRLLEHNSNLELRNKN